MEWIKYHEAEKVFDLRTEHSTYQMQVREYDTLVHLYYGSPVGDALITDRIVCVDRGFSGNPYEAEKDKTFSLDTLPQEYTAYGNGDYRINGLETEQADGSDTANLKFESYEITKGKYSLKGLPAMFAKEDEAETLEIVLTDRVSGLKAHLLYGVFPHLDVITRAVRLENTGTAPVTVKKAMSVEMDYEYRELEAVHFYGRHNMERQMERTPLSHGNWSVGSIRGTSSHHHNPFVILCDRNTEETYGNCYGYALAYSGNFLFETEVDQVGHTRVAMGIHPYHFSWTLEQGESFETPEVIMAYSAEGFGKLSRIYHDAYRSNLIRSKYTEQPRPILVNNWEATYFDFDADKIYHIAEEAKNIGLDMFV
ncbi:MAG: glycoside hydrolase family 36 N-terminal domain-containing protein, partial [Blautia sp.]|uniref:glycoside hydrolase family 36 N-terminal domain-containing protein n=1 Tax=Blautia sp. TaxID=1955243 RepID=UPI00261F8CCE